MAAQYSSKQRLKLGDIVFSHLPSSTFVSKKTFMYDALKEHDRKVGTGGRTITNVLFADDIPSC